MKKLLTSDFKSTGEEYEKILEERSWKKVDSFDLKRWMLLMRFFKGGKLIDLGCLDSMIPYLSKLKYPSSETWGLDQSQKIINSLQNQYSMVKYIKGDIYKTMLPDKYFDYIVLGEVIEHLERPEEAIKEAMRILKPKGVLALSTPLNEQIELGAVDKDHHMWSFDTLDIKNLLHDYGYVKIKVIGSKFFPYKYHFPIIISWCFKHV